jgi:hypothetical protein
LSMQPVVDFFAGWWLRSARYRWSKVRRFLCEGKYLKQPLPAVSSLDDIEACLKQVRWKMEGLLHLYDSISYPQTVWATKQDDCDGFATLAAELLYRLNPDYRPVLITVAVSPIAKSHTICVFNSLQGGLWYFDNARLKRDKDKKYSEIALKIGQRGKRIICWDVRNHFTFELIEFHRL